MINQNKELEIFNVDLDNISHSGASLGLCEKVFAGPVGKIIVTTEDSIILYDVNAKKTVSQIVLASEYQNMKKVVWNKGNSLVALVCKKVVHILTKGLSKVCSIQEKFNIKSVVWREGILVYSTINHLKYALINGESGILKCTEQKVRIVAYEKDEMIVLDSNGKILNLKIDPEEFLLKQALFEKNYERTKACLEGNKRLGNATIAYLYKKNYSALAMNLVTD